MGIQRWTCLGLEVGISDIEGNLVLFTDHERVVGEAWARTGEAQLQRDQFWDEVAKLRAEVEGLKKDAERRLDLIRATVENSEWRHGARNIYGELRREIQSADAAMEKGNDPAKA